MRSTLNSLHLSPALRACGIMAAYAAPALLVGTTHEAYAQNAAGQGTPLLSPAPNAAENAAPAQMGAARFEIEFKDIPVTELLIAIAKQGGVEIAIQGDVGGTLTYVHYKNVTAEEAIERVAADAKLFWGRRGEQYVVTRSLEDLPPELQRKYQRGATSRTANPDNGNSFSRNPGSIVPSVPFSPPAPHWGAMGQHEGGASAGMSGNFIPELWDKKDSKTKQTRMVKVRNVAPRMMAYWLDPANNPPDVWTEMSQRNNERAKDERIMKPVVTPESFNLLQSGRSAPQPYPYPYPVMVPGASPYGANPYAMNGMGGMPAGQPRGAFNQGNQPQFFAQPQMQPPARDGEWRVTVKNGWGRPFVQARPQFGQTGGGIGGGTTTTTGTGTGTGTTTGQVFELPEGIEAMTAVDAQNALLIRGTAAAVEELQSIIDLLDQPLRQVEVEAQFVTLTTSESKSLGINFNAANGPFSVNATTGTPAGNFVLGYVGRNFQATLGAALNNTRGKTIAAPRVIAINNLTASIFTTVTNTVLLNQSAINPGDDNSVIATAQVPFQITTSIGISVTPTINGDGTITVLMQPEVSTQNIIEGSTSPIPQVSRQQIQTVAIVNDGDTIALGGLRNKSVGTSRTRIPLLADIPFLGKLFQASRRNDRDEDLIIFLTARIVRRLPNEDIIPGT